MPAAFYLRSPKENSCSNKGTVSTSYLPQDKGAFIVNEDLDTFFIEVAEEYEK